MDKLSMPPEISLPDFPEKKPRTVFYIWIIISILLHTQLLHAQQKEVVILYTQNTNGYLEACECSKESLGGFPRRATVISELKAKYPYSILIDAGNVLSTYHRTSGRDSYVAGAIRLINYDALNVGGQEFVNGTSFLKKHFSDSPLVTTNLRDADTSFAPAFLMKQVGGLRVAILGITTDAALTYVPAVMRPTVKAISPMPALKETFVKVRESKPDVVILLLQASADLEIEKKIATAFPEINVIVSSYEGMETATPVALGKTLLVSAGHDGEKVGVLKLTIDQKTKKNLYYDNILRGLSKDIKEDETLLKLVEDYKKTEPEGVR